MSTSIPEILPSQVLEDQYKDYKRVDVRGADEYVGELAHAPGTTLVTLGPELDQWLEQQDRNHPIIFICRSGGRSGRATEQALSMGFKNVKNMTGGMILWNDLKLPTEK